MAAPATQNLHIAQQVLSKLGVGANPDEIATQFSSDLVWDSRRINEQRDESQNQR